MGAGKSTIGREVAERTARPFIDTDAEIERLHGPIPARLERGEPAQALVERSDVAAVEALAVVAEACVAFELARAARDKFGGDSIGDFAGAWRAYVERIPWSAR
jgi:gluconate kinase